MTGTREAATMRAAVITSPGPAENVVVETRPRPVPGAGEVLVRVHASAMNRADILQRKGLYPPPPGAPRDITGLEIAGTVVSAGPGAPRWKPGDRVFGLVPGGGHAEYAVAHEDTLVAVPSTLSWRDAGAVPEAFITANDALDQAAMRDGETVLVHAVASGVGLAAVQLVRARGGTALGTSRTPAKLDGAKALGLSDGWVADRGLEGLGDWVRSRTEGRGADVVLDLVGGAYFPASILALAPRGRLVLIGTMAGAEATIPLGAVLRERLTVRGTVLRTRALEERARDAAAFAARVVPLLARGEVRAVVDAVLPLDRIAEAHRLVETNATAGKVVIRTSDED
ncbi:MAG TPA: NAD(P)H-quinone oxidoreductase [Gemmatimonadaceae bacterium]|nr:NAD(P)H-quinone oxidoreductase [Gemmatimonadaceae bacterium]